MKATAKVDSPPPLNVHKHSETKERQIGHKREHCVSSKFIGAMKYDPPLLQDINFLLMMGNVKGNWCY